MCVVTHWSVSLHYFLLKFAFIRQGFLLIITTHFLLTSHGLDEHWKENLFAVAGPAVAGLTVDGPAVYLVVSVHVDRTS